MDMCTARGYPVLRIGVTDDSELDAADSGSRAATGSADGSGAQLHVQGQFSVPLSELAAVSRATLPQYFA